MHMVNDGHTHDHEHCHEHHHDHEHCHEHNHDHEHCHEHCEHHGNCVSEADRTLAVLKYMLDHNEHHALELDAMAKELRAAGKVAAADMIDKSVTDFQTANMRLRVAVSMLSTEA